MNILIITSSYPQNPADPSGAAGLFVRDFALELVRLGHTVVVSPIKRKDHYKADAGLTIVPISWGGGDQELASLKVYRPHDLIAALKLFLRGPAECAQIIREHKIDHVLAMWAVPSGYLARRAVRKLKVPYSVWCLGSDIWRIGKFALGRSLLRPVLRDAENVYADGLLLQNQVKVLADDRCEFLASSRKLPSPTVTKAAVSSNGAKKRLLFVGRYHVNKGPDLLVEAVARLPELLRNTFVLNIYGLGPLQNDLAALIAAHDLGGGVTLNGSIDAQDLANELSRTDYLIIPSRIESIPVVLSDALQCNVPVVVMPVGDLPSLINEFHCGVVAPSVTSEGLATAIQAALSCDPKEFLPGVSRARERFELSKTAARFIADL